MKKFLVLIMVVLMVFAMVACKSEPEQKSGDALPVEKEAGKDALMEQGTSGAKAVDHTGFKIVVTMNEGGESLSFNIGGKDDIYWYEVSGAKFLFQEHNGSTYMFMKLEAPMPSFWLKVADKSLKEEVFTEVVDALLYNAYGYKDNLTYVGEVTQFGRKCSKYSVAATVEGTNYSFSIIVDNEFGITMGMEASAGAEKINYTIDPKFSNVTADDVPTDYAAAKACDTFQDSMGV